MAATDWGLSIVAAIATAPDARLHLRPGQVGGPEVKVSFPAGQNPVVMSE